MNVPWFSQEGIPACIAATLALIPLFTFGFAPVRGARIADRLPNWARLTLPALLVIPWLIVAVPAHGFAVLWFLAYLLIPVGVAVAEALAARVDPSQRGHALDFLVLVALGLSVDLRWLEPAWPSHLAVIGKVLLLDAGLYGFLAIRRLSGVGYELRLGAREWKIGLREFAYYLPIALPLGLILHFLHLHARIEHLWLVGPAWVLTFVTVALPEEIFFRGWMQNLLERRLGRRTALVVTACIFGLSHFNKRAAHFNWRYVLLAAIAGIFYGRAWRAERRIGASAITHATVDTIWGAFLK